MGNGIDAGLIPHHINLTQVSQVSAEDYHQMIDIIKGVKEDEFSKLGLASCSIEDELNKVQETATTINLTHVSVLAADVSPLLLRPSIDRRSKARVWPSSPSQRP